MTESEFGKNFYAAIAAIKDAVNNAVVEACVKEGIRPDVASRVAFAASSAVESMGDRCYQSLSRGMKSFFRD
jgi:hypothetical protein